MTFLNAIGWRISAVYLDIHTSTTLQGEDRVWKLEYTFIGSTADNAGCGIR
jgi:hypothetical protein